jgi:hypothetical protein
MDESSERMGILELIESGQITTEEGLRRLAELQEESRQEESRAVASAEIQSLQAPAEPLGAEQSAAQLGSAGVAENAGEPLQPDAVTPAQKEDFQRWRNYWMIPLWIGIGVTILGGLLMYWALQSSGFGFWFICATLPFIVGVIVLVIGAQARTARWLHLRIQQAPGERPQRIAISFPIPIGLTAWFLRTFRTRIPGMENVPVDIDQFLYAVREQASPDNPIYIRVNEAEDGEKVEIYIG